MLTYSIWKWSFFFFFFSFNSELGGSRTVKQMQVRTRIDWIYVWRRMKSLLRFVQSEQRETKRMMGRVNRRYQNVHVDSKYWILCVKGGVRACVCVCACVCVRACVCAWTSIHFWCSIRLVSLSIASTKNRMIPKHVFMLLDIICVWIWIRP